MPPAVRVTRLSLPALILLALTPLVQASSPPAKGTEDPATGLFTIPGCRLVITDWSDGDSFPVKAPDGTQFTIRLYGADCFEWHVANDTDARRLRAQRRHFGIQDIQAAKDLGEQGALLTRRVLAAPFTVHTAWTDARGSARYKRYYAFVTTSTGQDLAALLVRDGLARAFGVYRQSPTRPANETEAHFDDLELTAARRGAGAWALTDWNRIADDRGLQRAEDAELELAQGDAPLRPGELIDLNTATRDDLMRLPGIGETMANRIIEKRPYTNPADLTRVNGIGKATLAKIQPFLKTP
jgi:competence protein ComEA